MMKNIDLIVYGSLNMDYVGYVNKLPIPGQTIASDSFSVGPGGKAANQAVSAAKLTAKTAMVGRVGDDQIGKVMKKELYEAGVDDENVMSTKDVQTGIAMVSVDQLGNNSIVTNKGANAYLTKDDIDNSVRKLEDSHAAILQLEMDKQVAEYAIETVAKHKKKVILNLAPIVDIDYDILQLVDLLIVNESEAAFLANMSVNSIDSAKKAIEIISQIGIENIVITLGGEGAVFKTGELVKYHPAPRVDAIDATGAGDCFVGAVSFLWTRSNNLDLSVKHAVNIAALAVTKKGALISLPSLEEYKSFANEKGFDFDISNFN